MPEARIRVAALHLAGARTLPLLCLGIGSGLQSRLVHHARSALKQQKLSTDPRAAPANASLCLRSPRRLVLRPVVSKKSAHPIVASDKARRTNPKNNASVNALGKTLRLWTDTSLASPIQQGASYSCLPTPSPPRFNGPMQRPQKITLGEMRSSGPRGLLVYCADYRCTHHVAIDADRWPDQVRLSDLEPKFTYQ